MRSLRIWRLRRFAQQSGRSYDRSRVNLERPVTPATRLSGHIVQGHVDATGEVVALDALGDGNWWLKVRVPK